MTKLEISLLGAWQMTDSAGPVKKELRRKEQGLLAYLAMEPDQAHSRESLVGLFWPEMGAADARNNLRVALSRLKRQLGNANVLKSTRHTVRLNPEHPIQLDAHQFLEISSQVETHDHDSIAACPVCQERIERAAQLYRGDFLTGFYLEDCLAFEEWWFVWRERLHVQMLKLLGLLVGAAEENGRFQQSEQYARRLLELDPLHEQAHRQLMRALYAQGQRSAALNQFRACAAILRDELGVEPEAETTFLRHEIEANTLDLSAAKMEPASHVRTIFPETTTPFIGRETELEQLGQRLSQRQYRLISLVGPGGIGKTRLAIQAARTQLDNYPDGIYFVPLEGVQSAAEIPSAIAETMKLTLSASAATPQAEMVRILQDKNLLLVIDNLEHLLDGGADFLLDLVKNAPNLVLLVTSRESINAQIEDLFRLRGLPFPEPGDDSGGGHFAAVRLFVDRSHRIKKTFALTEANSDDVAAICRLVEGLPLGVELAATWVRDFSVQQIAESLQADFDLLKTDLRDVTPRHRSIATVFEHSWRLLTDEEQTVLAQLSVFRGGFTLAAAQLATGASPVLLTRLRYKSLIRGSGSGRYTMHELLRQLSQRKLEENCNAGEQTREKHSRCFLTLLHDEAPKLNSAEAAQTGAALRLELDNIRQAWRWAVEHSDFDLLLQSTDGLAAFFFHEGLAFEGGQLFQMAIDVVQTDPNTEADLLPLLLSRQIRLLYFLIPLDELVVIIERLLLLTKQKRALANLEADAYLIWAKSALEQSADPKQVQLYLDKAAAVAGTVNDVELTAWLLCENGRNYFFDGQFDKAVDVLNRALALFKELDHLPGQASAYSRLAPAYAEAYQLGPALFCDRKALSLYAQIDNRSTLAVAHHNLGETYILLGAYELAIDHFEKSLVISRRYGDKSIEASTLSAYAGALNGVGRSGAAENHYRLAVAMQKELQLNAGLRFYLLDWGAFQQEQGWLTEAELTLDEALELNSDTDHLRITTQSQLATVLLAQGSRNEEALALADVVWQAAAANEGQGLPFPIKTMFECYLVFKACDDKRANDALGMAEKVLKKTAVAIEDSEMRATFLNNVRTNKLLRQVLQNRSQI